MFSLVMMAVATAAATAAIAAIAVIAVIAVIAAIAAVAPTSRRKGLPTASSRPPSLHVQLPWSPLGPQRAGEGL